MKQLVNNPSELTDVIDFYGKTYVQNDDGVMVPSEGKVFTTWCKVLSDLLKDYKSDAGTLMRGKTSFVIRHDQPKEIDTSMIIKWNSKTYTIDNILKDNTYKAYDTVVATMKK